MLLVSLGRDVHPKRGGTFTLNHYFFTVSLLQPLLFSTPQSYRSKLILLFLYPIWNKLSQNHTSVHGILDIRWLLHIAETISIGPEKKDLSESIFSEQHYTFRGSGSSVMWLALFNRDTKQRSQFQPSFLFPGPLLTLKMALGSTAVKLGCVKQSKLL